MIVSLPKQAQANFQLAATMAVGTGFELPIGDVSTRTIQQTEVLCNQLRQQAGQPGRVKISRRGAVVRVMAGSE